MRESKGEAPRALELVREREEQVRVHWSSDHWCRGEEGNSDKEEEEGE